MCVFVGPDVCVGGWCVRETGTEVCVCRSETKGPSVCECLEVE